MPSTFDALLARGIDSRLAQSLIAGKNTIAGLKQKTNDELSKLGLNPQQIDAVLDGSRPAIPQEILFKLLYDSRRTCCVCRSQGRPIIVHHLREWAESRSHEETNLVVLCLEHHDLAHTKKELSLSLKADEIRAAKSKWIEQAKFMDAAAILGVSQNRQGRWDYINYPRFFELALNIKPSFKDISTYSQLASIGMLDKNGMLTEENNWRGVDIHNRSFRTDGAAAFYFNHYMKELITRTFAKVPIVDLTNRLSAPEIEAILSPGMFFSCQLGFHFRDIDKFERGKPQLREAYYSKKDLRISFTFDAWNCTSSSGRYDAMTGHRIATPVCMLRGMQRVKGQLQLEASCYAVGTWFDNLREKRDEWYGGK